jgi:ribosomal protein L11 methyltransferase
MSQIWSVFKVRLPRGADSDIHEELLGNALAMYDHVGYFEAKPATDDAGPEWHVYFDPATAPLDFSESFRRAAEDFGLQLEAVHGPFESPRENWHDAWRQYFRPVEVTSRTVIVPSWEEHLAKAYENMGKLVLRIEPGMAFGTGTHATTQLCLRIAERVVRPGDEVLDAGTGSAILAIAAAKLGAKRVLGFDLDPDVVDNAADNLALNHVAPETVEIRITALEDLPLEAYDVILCNMLSHEFEPLLPALARRLRSGTGRLVLSGLLTEEEDEVRSWLTRPEVALRAQETLQSGEWSAIVATP